MKTLLLQIVLLGLHLGQWHVYAVNRHIIARRDYSRRLAPKQPATVAGLAKLLKWIDDDALKPFRPDRY